MILIKDGIERELTNKETIKIFKEAGWEEKIQTKVEVKTEQPKTRSKKLK